MQFPVSTEIRSLSGTRSDKRNAPAAAIVLMLLLPL